MLRKHFPFCRKKEKIKKKYVVVCMSRLLLFQVDCRLVIVGEWGDALANSRFSSDN